MLIASASALDYLAIALGEATGQTRTEVYTNLRGFRRLTRTEKTTRVPAVHPTRHSGLRIETVKSAPRPLRG